MMYMQNGSRLLLICIFLLVLQACTTTDKKAAMALSKTITTINDTVFYIGKIWGENVGQAVVTKDYTVVAAARVRQLNYLDGSLQTVANMHDVGGSEDLRNHELDFLKFEKQMFTNVAAIERFNATTSDEEVLKSLSDLKLVSKRETDMLTNIQILQNAYVARNGLVLDSVKK